MRDDDNLSKPLHSMSLRDIAAHNSYADHDLHRMRLLDILDISSRPILIFGLSSPVGADGLLQPTHCSPSLLASEVLLNLIARKIYVDDVGAFSIRPYSRFRQWLVKKGDDPMRQLEEAHICLEVFFWSATTIGNRWKIVSGLQSFLTLAKISVGFLQRRLARQYSLQNIT